VRVILLPTGPAIGENEVITGTCADTVANKRKRENVVVKSVRIFNYFI
jgi:hypothetical protein